MRQGQEIKCPECGRQSFLKKVSVTDGWTKKGDILCCASCSAKIADLAHEEDGKKSSKGGGTANLAKFLGGDERTAAAKIVANADEKRFCKDCRHFIKHPFADKCALTDKTVNPMGDCKDFVPRRNDEK